MSACTSHTLSPPPQPPVTQATRRAAPPNDGSPSPRAPRPRTLLPMGGRRRRAARAASPAEAAAGAGQGRGRSRYRRGLRSPRRESCAHCLPEGRSPREPGTAASERAGLAPGPARSEVRAMGEEKYLPELMAEKDSLDPSFVHASRLLAEGRTGPRRPPARAGRSWGGRVLCWAETVSRSRFRRQERSAGSPGSSEAQLLKTEALRSNGRVMRPVRVLDKETSKCQVVHRDIFTSQKPGKSVQE